jgi:hypothetical protein
LCYYCGDNFSDDALVFTFSNRTSTPVEEINLLQESWKEPQDEKDVHRNKHTTVAGMDLLILYDSLDGFGKKTFCKSYPEACERCMAVGHFSFQYSIIL